MEKVGINKTVSKKVFVTLIVALGAYSYGWINNYTLYISSDFYNPISIFFSFLSQILQKGRLYIERGISNEGVAQIFDLAGYSLELLVMNIDLIVVILLLAGILQKNINGMGLKKEYFKNKSIFNPFFFIVIMSFSFMWFFDTFVIEYRFTDGFFGLVEVLSLFSLMMFYFAIGSARKKTENI